MTEPKRCLSKDTVFNLLKMNPNDPRMRAFCSRHVIKESDSESEPETKESDSESEPETKESDFNEEWKWECMPEPEDSDSEYDPKWL